MKNATSFCCSPIWQKNIRRVIGILGFGYFAAIAIARAVDGNLTVKNLHGISGELSLAEQDERNEVLKQIKLVDVSDDNPSFPELIELINAQLYAHKKGFQIVVHVDPTSKSWWEAAKKLRLSEVVDFRGKDAAARKDFLKNANAFDIIRIIGENWGTPGPLQFHSKMVLSPKYGSVPYSLKEHLPDK